MKSQEKRKKKTLGWFEAEKCILTSLNWGSVRDCGAVFISLSTLFINFEKFRIVSISSLFYMFKTFIYLLAHGDNYLRGKSGNISRRKRTPGKWD